MARVFDAFIFAGTLFMGVLTFLLFRGDASFSEKFAYSLISVICTLILLFFMRWTIVWFWGALKK